MFDKDKEMGLILTSTFDQGEQFVLWNAAVAREDFPTKFGPAPQAALEVSKQSTPQQRFTVNTVASAIVSKVREAESDDFPALVMWRKVPASMSPSGEAVVLQFIAAWGAADGAPPRAPQMPGEEFTARTGGRQFPPATLPDQPAPTPAAPADDDLPF